MVYAIDTGTDQLAESLKSEKRVKNMPNCNYLDIKEIEADIAVIDVSFVSITKLVPKLSTDFNEIIALIKPQFECEKDYAKKHKGIVKDEKAHLKILQSVTVVLHCMVLKLKGLFLPQYLAETVIKSFCFMQRNKRAFN